MSTLCRGTLKEKIDWIYKMYDPRNTGVISWERLFFVITAMDDLIGYDARPPVTREQRIHHTDEIFNVSILITNTKKLYNFKEI